jgi:hypothetical protein
MINNIIPAEIIVSDVTEQDLAEIETLTAELNPHPITAKQFKATKKLLSLMDKIHDDIASNINAKREATYNLFFQEHDKFIPEPLHSNHLELLMKIGA